MLGQLTFEYILHTIYFFHFFKQALFTLGVSSLLSPLNDVSDDIVDDEGYFQFSPKVKFTYPYTFASRLQQTLKQNHCPSHNCYSFKNITKLLAFIWILKKLLLQTELSGGHVNLVICLNTFIRSFLKQFL